jgi:hypothetical protein
MSNISYGHVWVTLDGVWIGEWIYWPLLHKTLNYKHLQRYHWLPYFTNYYTLSLLSLHCLHCRCLVTALNNWDSSVSVLTSLLSDKYPATELLDELYHHLFSASLAEFNSAQLNSFWVGVRITLRVAVYRQSFRLCVKSIETHDQYYFSTEICGYSPLWQEGGSVVYNCCWLSPAQSF